MAKGRKLKVFRTPVGFHDAYVAATSQKAALEAWGADVNLFASGQAEEVLDTKLMEETLSAPGTVFRSLRGTEEEQIAALGAKPAKRLRVRGVAKSGPGSQAGRGSKPRPPEPSSAEVSDLEEAVDKLQKRHRGEQRDLQRREQELAKERGEIERRQGQEKKECDSRLADARKRYRQAVREWKAWKG